MGTFGRLVIGVAAALSAVGCNAVSGINDLAFDLAEGGGGFGGVVHTGGDPQGGGFGGSGGDCGSCETPPGECHALVGRCRDGGCVYAPLAEGTSCDDGNPCTEGDACDGAGQCQPGPECFNDEPCIETTCDPNVGCMQAALPDGTSCGLAVADRCCGGTCVDVSTDDAHCGGCGYACAPTEACESLDLTRQCAITSPDTSGRCTCTTTSECPVGQICRNQNRHPWRCTPEGPGDCPGTTFVDQSFCPNHCSF